MRKLMERLETINEGIQERVVHAQSTRALAEDIVMHAKSIADKNGIVITSDKGYQIWEGMITKHLRDSMKALEDYVLQKRIDVESLAGQDGRARDMAGESITEDPEDTASFKQWLVDFDGQLDDVINSAYSEAEDVYGDEHLELSPEFQAMLDRVVNSYCRQCNIT